MSNNLGMEIITEGVETEAQRADAHCFKAIYLANQYR
jgi:sensor c-di-GMP phosphodiesterase-like protein